LPFEELGRALPAPTLLQALADAGDAPDVEPQVSLLIGPEGGFDTPEVVQARAAGWQIVSLGPRILRAETAAIAAAALLTLRSS
jgi:16S rRNA (uracil1498-N3)-methyltransferase